MRDHGKILGTLFIVWGVLQAVGGVLALTMAREDIEWPVLAGVTAAVGAVVYAWIGKRLREHDPRFRIAAIVLSVLALFSFPIGTVLGIYGLWVLLRHRQQQPA